MSAARTPLLPWLLLAALGGALSCGGNAGKSPPPPPPCDDACKDAIALRSFREMLKLAFNQTLQGKPVGQHDETAPCPLGGTVHVTGNATSNPVQGATMVDLTYVLEGCGLPRKDTDPKQTYSVTVTGTATEKGTIAVQPSATTALDFASDSLTLKGTVYDPPETYEVDSCKVVLGQNGSQLSGTWCGRTVGLAL